MLYRCPMRPLLLALALLAFPSAAPAALKASFAGKDPGQTLVVEIADNGDARIGEPGRPDYGVLKDSSFYVVGAADQGVSVARIEDVAAAIDQVMPPIFKDLFANAQRQGPARQSLRTQQRGTRTIAGRTGQVIAIFGLDADQPGEAQEFVVSQDADLKPLGRTLEAFMNAAILPGAAFIGPAAGELVDETRAIFSLGTPLDAGGRFRLTKLETASIPAERFALPAEPATIGQLVDAMVARGEEMRPAKKSSPH